jgi:hypothetical protein
MPGWSTFLNPNVHPGREKEASSQQNYSHRVTVWDVQISINNTYDSTSCYAAASTCPLSTDSMQAIAPPSLLLAMHAGR